MIVVVVVVVVIVVVVVVVVIVVTDISIMERKTFTQSINSKQTVSLSTSRD